MKNQKIGLIMAGLTAALLIGCSTGNKVNEETSEGQSPSTTESQQITIEAPTEQTEETVREAAGPAESGSQSPGDAESVKSRPMTAEELKAIEEFIAGSKEGSYKNYGYLQSGYESPEYVDLGLVLYSGAGIQTESMTDGERKAYTESIGEIDTDIIHLSTTQINTFLKATAGIELKDYQGLSYGAYLPQFDTYYMQHGDTNMNFYTCPDGTVENDLYKVHCVSDHGAWNDTLTTLRKTGDSYQFVSNQFLISKDEEKDIDYLNAMVRAYANGSGTEYRNEVDFTSNIFNTDKRYFTKHELLNIDPYLLEIARNEIYARHGYIFTSSRLKEFFSQFNWYEEKYTANQFSDDLLNKYEKSNRDLIKSLEIWNSK